MKCRKCPVGAIVSLATVSAYFFRCAGSAGFDTCRSGDCGHSTFRLVTVLRAARKLFLSALFQK